MADVPLDLTQMVQQCPNSTGREQTDRAEEANPCEQVPTKKFSSFIVVLTVSNKSPRTARPARGVLACLPAERPLLGLWIGGYYPAEQFPRGTDQWHLEQRLNPSDIRFSPFAEDYESLCRGAPGR